MKASRAARALDARPGEPPRRTTVDYRRIARLFVPYWRHQAAAVALIIAGSLLGLVPGVVTARIISQAIPGHDFKALLIDVGAILASALLFTITYLLQGYCNAIVGQGIMRDLRTSLVARLQRAPVAFFAASKSGEILNRVSNDVDAIEGVATNTLAMAITSVVTIVTTVTAMLVWDWRLALIALAVLPLMLFQLSPGRRLFDTQLQSRRLRDEILAITQETLSISGVTLLKSFSGEEPEQQRFYAIGTRLMHLETKCAMIGRWFIAIIASMTIVGPALIWLGGGWLAITAQNPMTLLGTIVAFIGFTQMRLFGTVSAIGNLQVQIVTSAAVFERIFEYLDVPSEEYNPPDAAACSPAAGDVRFEEVCFSYERGNAVLRNVSVHVPAGKTVAFVGPSGAGKSTIAQLIPRFYEAENGRVLVDGRDVRTIPLRELRESIGIVSQDTYLFHQSIADNLRYAKRDATDDELINACKIANIHRFISSLPDGYSTIVGDRGYRLSGGERQRLAIARVVLKNPRILILDEATSALDSQNEAAIQEALNAVMSARTSIVIAHRLSTIVDADLIVVLDGGTIVEQGTHFELLARNGLYAALNRAQGGETPVPV